MKKQFTSIVAGVIASLTYALLFSGCSTCTANDNGENHRAAVENAKRYAKDLNLNVSGVTCAGKDTDYNGYVSCAVLVKGESQPIALECAGAVGGNTGCREPKVVVKNHNYSLN